MSKGLNLFQKKQYFLLRESGSQLKWHRDSIGVSPWFAEKKVICSWVHKVYKVRQVIKCCDISRLFPTLHSPFSTLHSLQKRFFLLKIKQGYFSDFIIIQPVLTQSGDVISLSFFLSAWCKSQAKFWKFHTRKCDLLHFYLDAIVNYFARNLTIIIYTIFFLHNVILWPHNVINANVYLLYWNHYEIVKFINILCHICKNKSKNIVIFLLHLISSFSYNPIWVKQT